MKSRIHILEMRQKKLKEDSGYKRLNYVSYVGNESEIRGIKHSIDWFKNMINYAGNKYCSCNALKKPCRSCEVLTFLMNKVD